MLRQIVGDTKIGLPNLGEVLEFSGVVDAIRHLLNSAAIGGVDSQAGRDLQLVIKKR